MRSLSSVKAHRFAISLDAIALAGYLLLAGVMYAPQLLGLRAFPEGDFTHHFLPFSLFQRSELLAGRLPVWNPYTYAGHPFLADTQAAVFYPLSNLWLALTLPFGDAAARLYLLQVEAVLHIVLAGFFTYLLVRDLLGTRGQAFLAGCVFAFSGYLTGYPPLQLAILRTAIWLPLVLWLLWRARQRPADWHNWIGASLAYVSAFLAGHPQTFLHLSYVVAAWIVLLLVLPGGPDTGTRRQWVLGSAVFFGLAFGLSAAQWWPSVEFTGLSVRASVDYDFVSGGFPLHDTWQMVLPGALTTFSPLYVSVVGLGLAVLGIAGAFAFSQNQAGPARPADLAQASGLAGGGHRPFVAFFAVLALVALFVSYGRNSFAYPLFYHLAPGWKLFRDQERAAYLVAFALSVLAAYGVLALTGMAARRQRAMAAAFAFFVLAGVAVFSILWQVPGRTAVALPEFIWLSSKALLLGIAFVLIIRAGRHEAWRTAALTGLVAADLILANFDTNLGTHDLAAAASLPAEAVAVQAAVGERREANLGLDGRTYNEYRIFDDYGMRIGAEEVWGSSPLRLARYAALFEAFPQDRMVRLTGVEHVLTWMRDLFEPSDRLAEFPKETDSTYLHRVQEPNPRAWLVNRARPAGDDEALGLLADHEFDLEGTALVAPEHGAVVTGDHAGVLAPAGANEIWMQRIAPNRLRIDVQSEHGGLLVVSENWMPGWRAVRRGGAGEEDSLPVVRADLTLLGIPVSAGRSELELVYWPDSIRNGLAVSGLTLAALLFACGWHYLRRRHHRQVWP